MDYITQHAGTILVFINSLGIIAGAIYLAYIRITSGGTDLRKQIAADYKERNDQLENKIKDLTLALNQTNIQIAELKGTLTEKDKHIKSLTEILQGRNPEVLNMLNELKDLNKSLIEFMKKAHESDTKVLSYQTTILEQVQRRSQEIDEASIEHRGAPMRVPVDGI